MGLGQPKSDEPIAIIHWGGSVTPVMSMEHMRRVITTLMDPMTKIDFWVHWTV